MGDRPSREELAQLGGQRLLDEGHQLEMFGPEGEAVPVDQRRGPGRPAGSGNKLKAKLKDYMVARGYRDPAEQLAMLAGLDRPDLHPMGYAAQIASALGEPVTAVAGLMRQAAAELLPYWHPKVSPDVAVQAPAVNILMAGSPVALGVEGAPQAGGEAFAPLDVRIRQGEQNQWVTNGDDAASDE